MIVELADTDNPTLDAFYINHSSSKSFRTDIEFIADIAVGLSALHICGVIHGDLKPQISFYLSTKRQGRNSC